MEKYLNKPVKEVIALFERAGKVLEEYNIGCVSCDAGSCLLKDVVGIHNLPEGKEKELFEKMAAVIYPGQKVEIPVPERERRAPGDAGFSPPLKRLADEHVRIKKLAGLIPRIISKLDTTAGVFLAKDSVYFIRNYADKFHHAKEEEILFKYFDDGLDIIKVMRDDHEKARAYAGQISGALADKDAAAAAGRLEAYAELLSGHIRKEDEILYPWMDRNLSTTQIGEIFSAFNEADEASRGEVIDGCLKFIEGIDSIITELEKEDSENG